MSKKPPPPTEQEKKAAILNAWADPESPCPECRAEVYHICPHRARPMVRVMVERQIAQLFRVMGLRVERMQERRLSGEVGP